MYNTSILITFDIEMIQMEIYCQKTNGLQENLRTSETTYYLCENKDVCIVIWILSISKTYFYALGGLREIHEKKLTLWDILTWNKPDHVTTGSYVFNG